MTVGRNDPCPCGSGRKYKQCCMRQDQSRATGAQAVARQSAQQLAGALNDALAHHNAGRLAEAEAIYRQMLQAEPNHADALHLSGLIAYHSGRSETAVELIGRAIAVNPSNPLYFNNLGNMLHEQGRLDSAEDHFRKALALMPAYPEAHSNLGRTLQAQGKLDEAAAAHRRALSIKPDSAEALNNLGNVLQAQGKSGEAIDSLQRALALKPDFADAHNNLGLALQDQGRLDVAVGCYNKALALKPGFAEAWFNLGNALFEQGKPNDAEKPYRKSLEIRPNFGEVHFNLGNALLEQSKLDEAEERYRKALAIKPDFAEACNALGATLRFQGRNVEAIERFRNALAFTPDFVDAHSNLLYAMQFVPGQSSQEFLAERRGFAARFEAPLAHARQPHRNNREPGRRLKIGYLSPDFHRHAVAYFMEPVFANHDKGEVEVFCYYNNALRDDYTDRIAKYADHWLSCKPMTDAALAERIRADGIDILVDLAGHTSGNRLLVFARKPAPVQLTYLGYPGTSGLAGMDYRITDAHADPEGSEVNYSEALLRMPHSLWCYRPDKDMPEVQPLPALQNDAVTFGSFNNANKIDAPCVELWAALLRALPGSRLLLVTVPEGEARERLVRLFAARGVGPGRLETHGKLPSKEFFRMLQRVDVTLDPVSVNGATTTCESLWLGVPVISLKGTRFLSRAGSSIMGAAGMDDFVADTPEGYIETAKRMAADLPGLARIRGGLRAKLAASALMDEAGFTRDLERQYRDVFARWCAAEADTPAPGTAAPG